MATNTNSSIIPTNPTHSSLTPTASSQTWSNRELRSMVLGHLLPNLDKENLAALLTLSKDGLWDIATQLLRDVLGKPMPESKMLIKTLEDKFPDRTDICASLVQRLWHDEKQYPSEVDSVDYFNRFPNLHTIDFDSPDESGVTASCTLRRNKDEKAFGRLELRLKVEDESAAIDFDIHSLYSNGAVGPGDGEDLILEAVTVHEMSRRHLGRVYVHMDIYLGLDIGVGLPNLKRLDLGACSIYPWDLAQILGTVPNLVEIKLAIYDIDRPSPGDVDWAPQPSDDFDYRVFRAVRHLRSLSISDPGGHCPGVMIPSVDVLLDVCPNLKSLAIPVRFNPDVASLAFGTPPSRPQWLQVDGEPVAHPKQKVAPRWHLDELNLKVRLDHYSYLSRFSLMYFLATAVPRQCNLKWTQSDSGGKEIRWQSPGGDEYCHRLEGMLAEWSVGIEEGRVKFAEELEFGAEKESGAEKEVLKPGWAMLPKDDSEMQDRRSENDCRAKGGSWALGGV